MPDRLDTRGGGARPQRDDADDLHLRIALPPIRFVDFTPEVQRLYGEVYEKTHGGFGLIAYYTRVLYAPHMPAPHVYVAPATKAPAQAIGWAMAFWPRRIFHPVIEVSGFSRHESPQHPPVVEGIAPKSYQWVLITDVENAQEGLRVALLEALEYIALVNLRAASQGAFV